MLYHDLSVITSTPTKLWQELVELVRLVRVWGFIRSLGLGRNPGEVPTLTSYPVHNSRMRRNPIVPNNYRLCSPANACLIVDASRNVVQQKLEQVFTFLFL